MRLNIKVGFQILIAIFVVVVSSQAQRGNGLASLSGEVTDELGAVIPQVSILVESEEGKLETKTSEIGQYNLKLKPGIYKMRVQGPKAFSKVIRGPFKIEQEKQAVINFTLYIAKSVVKPNENATAAALDDVTFSDFTTEEIEFPRADAIKSGVVIFGEKKDTGSTVVYTTFSAASLSGKPEKVGVVLTFNLFSLRADEITLRKNDQTIEARGNIIIEENGVRRIEKGEIKIKIVGDKLLIEKD